MRKQNKKKNKRRIKFKFKVFIIIGIIVILLMVGSIIIFNYLKHEKTLEELKFKIEEVEGYYNDFVITTNETDLYTFSNGKYVKNGLVGDGVYLSLDEGNADYENGYFLINNLIDDIESEYYVYYKDTEKVDNLITYDDRYKNYIPYNKTIVTNDKFSLYNEDDTLIYTFSGIKEMPIIINKDDFYGVLFDDRILYIKSNDIKEIKDVNNTDNKSTKEIAVLNYHFVYNPKVDVCDQIICHTEELFESHLKYIKDNNIFTPTLKELEMYIDGNIQLPKSVVITIDDGWHSLESAALLNKYQLNGTVFLITSGYDKGAIQSKYVETHSHTHDMHQPGVCPVGQGVGIQCLDEEIIQADLKKSRDRLNNTTYFCYPFYEYNNYSISQLKKAGFTMAFAGYNSGGNLRASVGIDKFQIPRYVIYSNTSVNQLKSMIG